MVFRVCGRGSDNVDEGGSNQVEKASVKILSIGSGLLNRNMGTDGHLVCPAVERGRLAKARI